MFHLEQSISVWHQQMLAAGIPSPVPLAELEIHLREEVECQMQSGISAEKAFALATQHIGTAPALKMEFLKTENTRPGHAWERRLAAAISLGLVIPFGAYALCKNDLSLPWRLLGFANLACIALAVFGCQRLTRMFPVVASWRIRTAIGLVFGVASMAGIIVFMNFILPKFEMTMGQLTVVVLWSMTLMAALGAVWAGLEEAARRQTNSSRS